VTPATISVDANGGSPTITVDANVSWNAESDQTWVTVSGETKNSFVINVAASTVTEKRTATVTVSGSGQSATVAVTQAAYIPGTIVLSVTPDAADVATEGGTAEFAVTSNADWTAVSNQTWAKVSPAAGKDNGTITVTAEANDGAERTATITVSAGTLTKTATVKQAAKPPLDLSFFTEVALPYTKTAKFSDDAVKVGLCDYWEANVNGVLAYKVTVVTAGTLTVADKTDPDPANIWWIVWNDPATVGCDETNALFNNYEGAASAAVEPGTYYIAGVSNKKWDDISLDAPYEVEITLEASHTVTAYPYHDAGNVGAQKGNLGTCYGEYGVGLKYEVHIAEEGDLVIASGESGKINYWLTMAGMEATCSWMFTADGFEKETIHLFPGTYVLMLHGAGDEYNYTLDLAFTPRVDAGLSDPDGISIAGVLWAKYNTTTDGSGKFVFAATEDGGDALYQWDRQYPASGSNWSTAGASYDLRNPTYTPCPDGWRLPSNSELTFLKIQSSAWAAKGSKGNAAYAGRFFGPNAASATIADPKGCIFIPAVGYIDGNSSSGYATYPGASGVDAEAHVKSSNIQGNDGNYWLVVTENGDLPVTENWARPWRAQSVRCVKQK
jgi:hypothetical protein